MVNSEFQGLYIVLGILFPTKVIFLPCFTLHLGVPKQLCCPIRAGTMSRGGGGGGGGLTLYGSL